MKTARTCVISPLRFAVSKNKMMKKRLLSILAIVLLLLPACREKNLDPEPDVTRYKLALIFPQSEWEILQPVVNWALKQVPAGIAFDLEWVDEDAANLPLRVNAITHDKSYAAIIGPEYSAHARLVARESLSYRIPVLMPMVTSIEFQRTYAETNKKSPNIFCLAQNDAAQTEAALVRIRHNGVRTPILICRSGEKDDYSASFEQYFAFMAREAGFHLYGSVNYDSEETLAALMNSMMDTLPDYDAMGFFFVPSSPEDMLCFDRIMTAYKDRQEIWPILCSDIANDPSLEGKLQAGPYEGFSLGATEAFERSWQAQFHYDLPGGYAQLYDAVGLVAAAARLVENGSGNTLREALAGLILDSGYNGASGRIHYGQDAPIMPEQTIYRNWAYRNGKFSLLTNIPYSMDGGWDWSASDIDDYDDIPEDRYPFGPVDGHAAFIVATSTGWNNYRHQADALAMYQMLKGFGYTDDQIVLVMEDDIADHPDNPHPGEVRVTPDGEDLRKGAVVDYKLSSLSPEDIAGIFSGHPSERTPVVLPAGFGTNVLVFWSGHGVKNNELKWGGQSMSAEQFETCLVKSRMNFRRMFVVMDTCYSGSVAEYCSGNVGVLFLCSAAQGEPSHADIYDESYGTYLSNGFTRAFRSAVENNPSITLNNLYKEVARETTGSHAGVYNYLYYGSLYRNTFEEYSAVGR